LPQQAELLLLADRQKGFLQTFAWLFPFILHLHVSPERKLDCNRSETGSVRVLQTALRGGLLSRVGVTSTRGRMPITRRLAWFHGTISVSSRLYAPCYGACLGMRGRIFIVEDEPIVALNYASILEEAGHEVVGPISTIAKGNRSNNPWSSRWRRSGH
jgi:hypothetical protein